MKKIVLNGVLVLSIVLCSMNYASAADKVNVCESVFEHNNMSETLSADSPNLVLQLEQISTMSQTGLTSEEEYEHILFDSYHLSGDGDNMEMPIMLLKAKDNSYYPEVQCGYINYSGVKYLYKHGISRAKGISAILSAMVAAIPGCGWGITAVGIASSFGGYSSFEKAVHKAYSKKKGIKVYYKIHKSITCMNQVRYVVG